jgi:hypothetical protein
MSETQSDPTAAAPADPAADAPAEAQPEVASPKIIVPPPPPPKQPDPWEI